MVVVPGRHAPDPVHNPGGHRAAASVLLRAQRGGRVRQRGQHHPRGALWMVHPVPSQVVREPHDCIRVSAHAAGVFHGRVPEPAAAHVVGGRAVAGRHPGFRIHRVQPGVRADELLGRHRCHEHH